MLNMKSRKPAVNYPLQPNVYTGPILPFGTPPKNYAPAPFWYMQKQNDPMLLNALIIAFKQSAKPVQKRVNHQRRPFDAVRGY